MFSRLKSIVQSILFIFLAEFCTHLQSFAHSYPQCIEKRIQTWVIGVDIFVDYFFICIKEDRMFSTVVNMSAKM